jgi:Amt family ammonium transporter
MGFAMLCAGAVRSKNCMNICLMNVLDPCFSAPAFFLVGYGFAHGNGTPSNGFIGNNDFALEDFQDWHQFIFQWAFAAASATITTGSVAERCTFQV